MISDDVGRYIISSRLIYMLCKLLHANLHYTVNPMESTIVNLIGTWHDMTIYYTTIYATYKHSSATHTTTISIDYKTSAIIKKSLRMRYIVSCYHFMKPIYQHSATASSIISRNLFAFGRYVLTSSSRCNFSPSNNVMTSFSALG